MIRLSILIPVYNWDCTKLVNDLLEQLPEDAEIIIGNDKSTDKEVIAALQRISCLKQCRVYEPVENLGRSRIRNRIFDLSHGEWLLFVDCDTEVTSPYFVKNYLDATEEVKADAYCGGMRNTDHCPKGCELRWTYEDKVAKKLVSERSLGENGSIAGLIGGFRALRVAAPAVADDKYYGFISHARILSSF